MLSVQPHLKPVAQIIEQVIATGQASNQREFTITLADGQSKQLIDFHFPLDKQSELSLVLDITERK